MAAGAAERSETRHKTSSLAGELLPGRGATDAPPVLTILLPTKNEADNIEALLARLAGALGDIPCELVFVDDSSDQTAQMIRSAQNKTIFSIRLISRPPHRQHDGLAGAVVEGLRAAQGTWICVMDADLQHPPETIPSLLHLAQSRGADLAIASRTAAAGGFTGLSRLRTALSRGLIFLTRLAFWGALRDVGDPLTGFFLLRREAVEVDQLRPTGFKILLEILVRCQGLKIEELPFDIQRRHAGASKASFKEGLRFLRLFLTLQWWRLARFTRFIRVGFSGLGVNHLALYLFTELAGLHYLVSAALATQFSTLWNFTWAEKWVFADRDTEGNLLPRLGGYLLMNNLMLALRSPLLYLLATIFEWHYLLANLISILVTTMARYLISNAWLWPERPGAPQNGPFWYDIHGLLQLESAVQLPELASFRVSQSSRSADIRLQVEARRNGATAPGTISYDEGLGNLGFRMSVIPGDQTRISASTAVARSPHVLYTNVIEPVIRWSLVRKGYALVHGACLALDGQALLLTARTDTGKTTTILNTLAHHPCAFLADDMTILSRDGHVYSYPKPLTISLHTLKAVPAAALSRRERLALQVQSRLHSRTGRRLGMILSRLRLPAASLNAAIQMLIPPPKYRIQKLVPGVKTLKQAALARLVIIERGHDLEELIETETAVRCLLENSEDAYGFPPYPVIASELSQWQGRDLHPAERAIVRQALRGLPVVRLVSSNYGWWRRLPAFLMHRLPLERRTRPLSTSRPTRPRRTDPRTAGLD